MVVVAVRHDHRVLADHEPQHVELVVPSERAVRHRKEFPQRSRITDDRQSGGSGTQAAHRPVLLAEIVEDHMRGLENSTKVARLVTPRRAGEWA